MPFPGVQLQKLFSLVSIGAHSVCRWWIKLEFTEIMREELEETHWDKQGKLSSQRSLVLGVV